MIKYRSLLRYGGTCSIASFPFIPKECSTFFLARLQFLSMLFDIEYRLKDFNGFQQGGWHVMIRIITFFQLNIGGCLSFQVDLLTDVGKQQSFRSCQGSLHVDERFVSFALVTRNRFLET
jgi:hypothetical protein